MIRISTERLTLRTPLESDVTAYLAYRNEQTALASQHLAAMTIDEAQIFLREQTMRSADVPGWLMLAVEETSTRRLIGETGVLCAADHVGHGNIGWWFHSAFQGQGFATEAARALIGWCFETLNIERIDAACLAGNTRSIRVMERLGLRPKLTAQARDINGVFHEQAVFETTREDWTG